ncbi:MAG TPA: hypothetical protein VFD65_01120 [Chitinophagales bacterium]|nr:hypothetical protein [Chitinophagales bacterium]
MSVVNSYRKYVLEHHQLPKQVSDLSMEVTTVSSIKEVESQIWKRYASDTFKQCVSDASFGEYIAREKMLAYVFTLIHNIQDDDIQIKLQYPVFYKLWTSKMLRDFKQEFLSFVKLLIEEGQDRGEIEKRVYLNRFYPELFWNTLLSILSFWINDKSTHKEQTDVAVEKWVHLLFDTLAPNAIDSAIDLAQFIFKQKVNEKSR